MRSGMSKFVALALAALILPGVVATAQEAELPVDPEVERTNRLVDEIIGEVETIRGLEFKAAVKRNVFSSDEIRKLMKEMMERDMPPEKLRQLSVVSARLGFFPPGTDIADALSELLEAGAAGFYDPETKTLNVLRGLSPDGARPVIFHELIHALEDQYFDLGKLLADTLDAMDRGMAIRAVVEGSATVYTSKYLAANPALQAAMNRDMAKQMMNQMKAVEKTPLFLTVMMVIFPYTTGEKFVQGTTGGDPGRLAALYELMPVSSEQILHRSKYGPEGDYPTRIRQPDFGAVLPGGYKRIHEDLIGELGIAILLNEFLGGTNMAKLMRGMGPMEWSARGDVKAASEGWDGDSLLGFEGPKGEVGLIWASRWDSDEDALEFAAAYGKGLTHKQETLGMAPDASRIEVRGDRVMIVEGFPAEAIGNILAHAWAGTGFEADPRDAGDVKSLGD